MKRRNKKRFTGRAMDKQSARMMDDNGYVTVMDNPISQEGVYDYLGSEIPGWQGDPFELVPVYRPAEELSKQETIDSFKLLPFIDDHTWLGEGGTDAGTLPFSGMTGEQVRFDGSMLRANLKVVSMALKNAIESGKVELSPGYKYAIDPTPGIFNGKPYKLIMRNLRGNHLALVDAGRTGKNIAVMDSATTSTEKSKMTLEELIAAIAKLDGAERAALLAAINHSDDDTTTDVTDPDVVPDDATVVDDAPGDDAPTDDKTTTATATDSDAMKQVLARLATLEKESKRLAQGAMDTAAVIKAIGERDALADRLTPHVGVFACDSMTALQVAKYGLEKLGITDVAPGAEIATLNGALAVKQAAQVVSFANDSAPVKNSVTDAINTL